MVPLLYVYVRKNCLQYKKDDEEVYAYVYVSVLQDAENLQRDLSVLVTWATA